jgi:predicted AAA+ superfamily ATPase
MRSGLIAPALSSYRSQRVIQLILFKSGGADNKTIDRYVELLERCFAIFQLGAFSRNLRNEIKRGKKIYFYEEAYPGTAIEIVNRKNYMNFLNA